MRTHLLTPCRISWSTCLPTRIGELVPTPLPTRLRTAYAVRFAGTFCRLARRRFCPTRVPTFVPARLPTPLPKRSPTLSLRCLATRFHVVVPNMSSNRCRHLCNTFADMFAHTMARTFPDLSAGTFAHTFPDSFADTLADTCAGSFADTFVESCLAILAETFALTLARTFADDRCDCLPSFPDLFADTFANMLPTLLPTRMPTILPARWPTLVLTPLSPRLVLICPAGFGYFRSTMFRQPSRSLCCHVGTCGESSIMFDKVTACRPLRACTVAFLQRALRLSENP